MKKIFSLCLCFALLPSLHVCAQADDNEEIVEAAPLVEIKIYSAQQFIDFAENCILDTYSKRLAVSLEKNIDLSNCDFEAVPIFCGSFDGNGYTISGFTPDSTGSVLGLFRYLTEGAEIKNLNVKASIKPSGSHNQIGGIVGNNAGLISNCSYNGAVVGSNYVGGIAGVNEITGIIEDCYVAGEISGDHFVGGIAGENSGVIRNCSNVALINVSARENAVDLSDVTVDTMTNSEAANTVTDIGGIAGFSDGVIRNCENYGDTGYPKMGYNIGGIAGTQSGYLVDCVNYADIQGRKEVGGIAGQLEPVSLIEYSEDTLQILEGQLDTMSGLVNQTAYNAQVNSAQINSELGVLADQTGTAMDAVDTLLFSENADPDTITAAQNALSNSMGAMPETFGNLAAATSNTVNHLSSDLMAVSNQINAMSDTINEASENIGGSISDVSDEDSEDQLSGKIAASVNCGDILGDFNVGGIAGAISVENDLDVMDDWQQMGSESLNFETKLRAVILKCENRASVCGSKQNIGGIVGFQHLGLVKDSLNTGFVDAEPAEFVGGVSGRSSGFIRNNYAKCIISAKNTVGGIAGSATIVSDCRSLVEIKNAAEKLGGILGDISETDSEVENPIISNLYMIIGRDIGGIDGISYSGLAQGLGKYQFLALDNLPDIFKKLVLTFSAEGSKEQLVLNTGDKLSISSIPTVPERTSTVGSWDGLESFDFSAVYFDTEFKAVYKSKSTVLSSNRLNHNGLSLLLVQGNFGEDSSLLLHEISFDGVLEGDEESAYCARFSCGDNSTMNTVRCLIPDDVNGFKLYLGSSGGDWREVEYSIDGSYAVAQLSDGDDRIAIVKTTSHSKLLIAGAAAAAAVLLISTFVLIFKLTKKSRSAV